MPQNIVGSIPEFAGETSASERVVKEAAPSAAETSVEETKVEEKETPEPPTEKPTEELAAIPSEDTKEPSQIDSREQELQLQELRGEKTRLIKELAELRGQKRELKQQEITRVEAQIDELKDVNPEDAAVVEKILRAKGYMTKEETNRMFYENVKREEEEKFFNKFPEYKEENDPDSRNWNLFQDSVNRLQQIGWQIPSNPRKIAEAMELIHKNIYRVPSERSTPIAARKRQVEVASAGAAGGAQRSSPKSISPEMSSLIRTNLKGFSPEEIKALENRLSE